MTDLDKALAAAEASPEDEEAQMNYYECFLRTDFYVPIDEQGAGGSESESDDEHLPLVIVEAEGNDYLMLFDTLERLEEWSEKRVGYTVLPGHVIVQMMEPEVHWMLNAGADSMKEFVPEEIEWFKSILNEMVAEVTLSDGTTLQVAEVPDLPEELEQMMIALLEPIDAVSHAHMAVVCNLQESEMPNYALVICSSELPDKQVEEIAHALAQKIEGFLGEDEGLDIHFDFKGNEVAQHILHLTEPFYTREQ